MEDHNNYVAFLRSIPKKVNKKLRTKLRRKYFKEKVREAQKSSRIVEWANNFYQLSYPLCKRVLLNELTKKERILAAHYILACLHYLMLPTPKEDQLAEYEDEVDYDEGRYLMELWLEELQDVPPYSKDLLKEALDIVEIDLQEAEKSGSDKKAVNTHSEDFTSVCWNGKQYQFNKTQAQCVKLLWNDETLSEKTIGDKIESASDNFRLQHVFRNWKNKGKGMHPAWGKMIVKYGKGIYGLNRSAQKSQKNHT